GSVLHLRHAPQRDAGRGARWLSASPHRSIRGVSRATATSRADAGVMGPDATQKRNVDDVNETERDAPPTAGQRRLSKARTRAWTVSLRGTRGTSAQRIRK